MRMSAGRIIAILGLLIVPGVALAQQQRLPEGVTQAMINEGKQLFAGTGLCAVCHGPEGKGMPSLGANLTDAEWLHSNGSYAGILETVQKGVTSDKSSSGTVMPPKGGSTLNDAQLKAVAAYVWSLSQKK